MADDSTKAKTPEKQKEDKSIKASPKLKKIIEEIEKLTVIELAGLVKALEDKFGVASVPMAAPAAAPAAAEKAASEDKPQQAAFNVILTAVGNNKLSVIKVVRELDQNLGLKEAKDLVETAPKEVLSGAKKEIAEEAKKKLESAGATVELK